MSQHQQNTPLTLVQLWDSYERNPIPRWMARSADQRLYDESPPFHPPERFTYYPLPPTLAVEKHACRLFKLALRHHYATIFLMDEDCSLIWQTWNLQRHHAQPSEEEYDECLDSHTMTFLHTGNKMFRNQAYGQAVSAWLQAWTTLLPYHVDALPHGALRNKLGFRESTIIGNVSACLLKMWNMAKAAGLGDEDTSSFEIAAFQCAWIVIDLREYARVRTVYSACRRAEECLKELFEDGKVYGRDFGPNAVGVSEMRASAAKYEAYAKAQGDAIQNADRELLFRDLDKSLEVQVDRETTRAVGPLMWDRLGAGGDTSSVIEQARFLDEQPLDYGAEAQQAMAGNRNLVEREWWYTFEPMEPHEEAGKGSFWYPPSEHPTPRLTYLPYPTGLSFVFHLHALTKLSLYEIFFRQYHEDYLGEAWEKMVQEKKREPLREVPPQMRLHRAEKLKDEGNAKYKAGNHKDALKSYFEAWWTTVPYHYYGFPNELDALRDQLAKIDSVIFANISAVYISLLKAVATPAESRVPFQKMAYLASWVAAERKFNNSIKTMINICTVLPSCVKRDLMKMIRVQDNRLLFTLPRDLAAHQTAPQDILALTHSWTRMRDALGKAKNKDAIYKEAFTGEHSKEDGLMMVMLAALAGPEVLRDDVEQMKMAKGYFA
ncbi:hypothetical protein L198_04852 [Cryptococcus wingfieldii CBS 7118]|uniref:Uncharacterized protein n=1 Tax=Cryptococcus wingfieldii CBS 7118 TaxID=1295528 RepID=A0A1E3J424_9TREE|nr:hypothetical protein L198_04852 [Cryptococcus wingfieldii CBS 7118]ODN94711.1 hypothetical protein L198_04852 [Cryptococcus wingfieldii CBS 7118]